VHLPSKSGFSLLSQAFFVGFLILRIRYLKTLFMSMRVSAPVVVVTTFLLIIGVGTVLLSLPVATVQGRATTMLDALFTATSATCVTGLIVQDTGSHFSLFGQGVILVLIQIGGLGIMTFASFFSLITGNLGVRDRVILRDIMRYPNLSRMGVLLLGVLGLTLAFEAVGATLLYFQFLPGEAAAGQAAYSAVFHAISAFCNAGFSLYSTSFVRYSGSFAINFIMAGLIIAGGLGFVVLISLLRGLLPRTQRIRKTFSLNCKLVLIVTGTLLLVGTVLFYIGERHNTLANLSLGQGLLASFFQSVTARTAGFNTVSIGALTSFSSLCIMLLMFIGASPGSTGGGIKTSTFATLLVTIRSMILGKDQVEVLKRTIPRTSVYAALSVVTLALGWLSISSLLLCFTEGAPFLQTVFEVFSAFGTVGLSQGLTPHLTSWGKLVIIVTMFMGRLGPLTLALAIAGRQAAKRYEYARETVVIG
jgi:trk system potassium uptake protein TrkH